MTLRRFAAGAALVCLLAAGAAPLAACGSSTEPVVSEPVTEVTSSAPETTASETKPAADTLSLEGVYTDPEKSYQITLPDNWIKDTASSDNNRVLFLSPSGKRSVEIVRQKADSNLMAYSEAEFKKAYAAKFDDFKLLEYLPVKANGLHGVRLWFTCTQNGKKYMVAQFIMAGEYDYNITWSALDCDKKFFRLSIDSVKTIRELDPRFPPADKAGRLFERTYTDTENRYTIKLPKNWKVSSQKDNQVLFVSADKKSNINIQTTEIDQQLYRYKKSYFTSYFQKAFGKSASITTFTSAKINGVSARYLEVRYSHNGQSLTSCQYLINSGEHTYSITYTAPTNGLSTKDFAASAKTFKLK